MSSAGENGVRDGLSHTVGPQDIVVSLWASVSFHQISLQMVFNLTRSSSGKPEFFLPMLLGCVHTSTMFWKDEFGM